ncbi:MAG: arsenic efflux protein [Bacteroidia bacterium]|nr:arsenic efflux protein [Bacteroidia bacterium]
MELNWLDIFKQTFMISGFVLFLMLIIEYINVQTKGKWSNPIKNSRWLQLFIAIFLGITPGCAGVFTVVSLYTHNIINFSALLAGSIATVGDEAFVMISASPVLALKIAAGVIIIAIVAGVFFNLFIKSKPRIQNEKHFVTHGDECCSTKPTLYTIKLQLQKFTFARAMLLMVLIFIIFSQIIPFGEAGGGEHEEGLFSAESIIFMLMGLISTFIILTVPEHFLMDHLWEHVLKKHFFRLFLWTLGSIIAISILTNYFSFNEWAKLNLIYVLLLALIIGIIPISGPHILFITLFMDGIIPFSFLLANSVVQEGHGGIPLLAEDKWSFVKIKAIKIVIGLIIGLSGMYFSF